ncbi:MAG: hypothetical protein MZV63_14175 [Marinilabiliales bacterium]|nr:hypothetical protein [Marinilabiliales bacterium]
MHEPVARRLEAEAPPEGHHQAVRVGRGTVAVAAVRAHDQAGPIGEVLAPFDPRCGSTGS